MEIGKRFSPYMMFIGSFVPNVLLEYKGISSSAKLLWARLSQHAGKGGICYPAQATLAQELGLSIRQIRRLTNELAKDGFIRVIYPKPDKYGRPMSPYRSCRYHFLWHKIFDEAKLRTDKNVKEPDNDGWLSNYATERLRREIQCELDNRSRRFRERDKGGRNNKFTGFTSNSL